MSRETVGGPTYRYFRASALITVLDTRGLRNNAHADAVSMPWRAHHPCRRRARSMRRSETRRWHVEARRRARAITGTTTRAGNFLAQRIDERHASEEQRRRLARVRIVDGRTRSSGSDRHLDERALPRPAKRPAGLRQLRWRSPSEAARSSRGPPSSRVATSGAHMRC